MRKIKEIMNKDILTVKKSTTFSQLLEIFKGFHSFPLVPVTSEDGTLEGVVYFEGLIEAFTPQHFEILKTLPLVNRIDFSIFDLDIEPGVENLIIVDDLMDTRFNSVKENTTVEEAYREMEVNSCDMLPVVDGKNKLVGIIGRFDIVMNIFKDKGIL